LAQSAVVFSAPKSGKSKTREGLVPDKKLAGTIFCPKRGLAVGTVSFSDRKNIYRQYFSFALWHRVRYPRFFLFFYLGDDGNKSQKLIC
jgi:hypothetical protein